jgi:pSer/pThr/pTyr-binding forkhead associated (FHA) protein
MAKLILRDDGTGKEFDLDKTGSLTVGRSPDCDIPINDTQASRRHCSVIRLQSGYEVSDLGSTNGTLVNSTLVKRQKLKHGDVIRIGAVEIAFDDPSSAGAAGEMSVGYLVYAKGDKKGQRCELSGQRTTIGRKPTNTIVVEDAVSSSYHCEIVRGLNGYAIRDLGSTNGTLVNGEMVTEAQLSHGARIRVGNTRFVFQDPALAEIDLELAGAEDEDEWGMMREIDLAAVRKRNPATVVYALLFVAIVGAAGYFLAFAEPAVSKGGPEAPPGNLHEDHSFEAAVPSWRGEPETGVSVGTSTQAKGMGSQSLEVRSSLAYAEAFYETRLPLAHASYRLQGSVAARGARARLGLLWIGAGLRRWATAPAVGTGGLSPVDVVLSAPPWASSAMLGVRIDGEGTVYLDDVTVVKAGEARVAEVKGNEFRVDITDGLVLDLFHSDAAILVSGRPFARDAEGRDIDAAGLTLRAEAQDTEHILVTVEGALGAQVAGVVLDEVNGYLSRGGFRAFTPEDKEKPFHPAFPDEGALALKDVRKLLLGPSGRSFAALAAADGARLDAEARVEGKTRSVALLGPASDGRFAFRFKVDLRGENQLAMEQIANALALDAEERWGDFVVAAQQVLAEFPFAQKVSRDQLYKRIREVNEDYERRRAEIDRLRAEYRAFKDQEDLDRAAALLRDLEAKFQIKPGESTRGQHLDEAKEEVSRLDLTARQERQTKAAEHTFIQAKLVDLPDGRLFSAALQFFYVCEFLPDSKQAPEARALYDQIGKDHPQVNRVLEKLGFTRKR